jgi:hypothetical protein
MAVYLGSTHVNGNLGTWRGWSLSPGHDRHDGGPEGTGWFCAPHGAWQGSSDTVARLVLGGARHAPGPIIQRNNHDDDQPCQRGLVDVPARAGPRLRRERRYDGYRLAGRAYWRPRLAYGGRTADDLRRRADQASGQRPAFRSRRRACRIWACAFRADDSAAGNGWVGRAIAPGGPAGGSRRS